jgi:hypothetical protein
MTFDSSMFFSSLVVVIIGEMAVGGSAQVFRSGPTLCRPAANVIKLFIVVS